jgi:hypothetical protein
MLDFESSIGKVCPKCSQPIQAGQLTCPVSVPYHAPCNEHHACYTLCLEQHPEMQWVGISRWPEDDA